ncbi:hypothetical protein PsYK624_083180 [Phanerochaete sordida]|uniref:Uncharacterized protein n=1 Tax=Phanerochaete sordida TaxID=48140 RepID=A0A9P3GCI0_9APHY|nr:hypothetical protein PsYK624_083180 [Phanerochaete sordida]
MSKRDTVATDHDLLAAEQGLPTLATPSAEDQKEISAAAAVSTKRSAVSPWIGRLLFCLCILMHIILVAFHAVLVGVRRRRKGTAFVVEPFILGGYVSLEDPELFVKLSLVPNAIIKIYLVPLLYLTQLLALRRDLHLKQTLTAMHDKSQAWLSLGATGVTVFKYIDLFKRNANRDTKWHQELTSLATVFGVFMYLAGSLVLGIIAPDLISTSVHDTNNTNFERYTMALPSIGQNISLLQDAYPVVNLLPLLINDKSVNINGLSQNIIYDVPLSISESPSPTNATIFEVSCEAIAGGYQAGDFNAINSTVPIHVHDALMDIDITPLPRSLNIRSSAWLHAPSSTMPPPVLLLASTLLVRDGGGSLGKAVLPLNTTLSPEKCISTPNCTSVSSVQLMACTATYQTALNQVLIDTINWPYIGPNISSFVNAGTLYNLSFNNLPQNWTNWSQPETTMDPILSNIGSFPSMSPSSHAVQLFQAPASTKTSSYTYSLLEESVMEAAGYYGDAESDPQLLNIEATLASALAAVFLRAALTQNSTNEENLYTVFVDPQYWLEIKNWQPWLGTAVSVMMLVLAVILTRQPARNPLGHEPHVSGLGVLQLTWLLGRDTTDIAKRTAELDDPTAENLREHGKTVEVEFADY